MRSKLRLALGLVGLTILLVGTGAVIKLGPRFIIGILRYDTRQEGKLRVGDQAPDVGLLALDGTGVVQLAKQQRGRPLVVVFGSFT